MTDSARPPGRNLELKARCLDLDATRARALAGGASQAGLLVQVDTYFGAASGRLKLREINGSTAELIAYHRANSATIRPSDYIRVAVAEPAGIRSALSSALGIVAVVHKRRDLLIWKNVRIHLDRVDGLGDFVEFEAVISSDADEAVSRERVDQLIEMLHVRPEDRVASSYVDLIQQQTPPAR